MEKGRETMEKADEMRTLLKDIATGWEADPEKAAGDLLRKHGEKVPTKGLPGS